MVARKTPKARLDSLLVKRGLVESRQKAQALILAGEVEVDGQLERKSALLIDPGRLVTLRKPPRFVSRGGLKLEHALVCFGFSVEGLVILDAGASTGGFTDCLLQRGARRVYAVDVGSNQLDYRMRTDPRVVVMEKTNVRYLETLPEPIDGIVCDVSFISLTVALPTPIDHLLGPGGFVVTLIKPQFEAGRGRVGKGGVVRDPATHREVLLRTLGWALERGLAVRGLTTSPIRGPAGNVEFLAYLVKSLESDESLAVRSLPRLENIVEECLTQALAQAQPQVSDEAPLSSEAGDKVS